MNILKYLFVATAFVSSLLFNRALSYAQINDDIILKRGEEVVMHPRTSYMKGITKHRLSSTAAGMGFRLARTHDAGIAVIGSQKTQFQTGLASTSLHVTQRSKWANVCKKIFKALPELRCEANHIFYAFTTPNDPYYRYQWGLTKIKAASAWDISTGSLSALIGIVDSGITLDHADLSSNVAVNTGEKPSNRKDDDHNGYVDDYQGYDFVDNDGVPQDANGHGSHVSGIVAGIGNNGRGGVGVNWRAGIVPVRVMGPDGSGTSDNVAAGIFYAVKRKVHAINLSLGSSEYSSVIESAISKAKTAGIVVVVAAGNNGSNNDQVPTYPANSKQSNVISVAATDQNDNLANFSNYGAKTVHLAAPGVQILSSVPNNQYAYMSGTSMAAPFVSGAVALVKATNPTLSATSIKRILISTVDSVSALRNKTISGGRLNLYNAVRAAR